MKKKKLSISQELVHLSNEFFKLSEHMDHLRIKSPQLPKGCRRMITRRDIKILKVRLGLIKYTLKLPKGKRA